MPSGIYQIRNTVNGKVYVGSAVNFSKRKSEHFIDLRRGEHPNRHLQNAAQKYGIDAFVFEVLEECVEDLLLEREQIWIDQLCAVEHGYNIRPRAKSNLGLRLTDEQKANRKPNVISPEGRMKISAYSKARWADPDYAEFARQRMHEAQKLIDPDRRSAIARARAADPKLKRKLSEARKRMWAIGEYRERRMQQMRERYEDPTERQRSGEHSRQRWADQAYKIHTSQSISRSKQARDAQRIAAEREGLCDGYKRCKGCGEIKPEGEFHRHNTRGKVFTDGTCKVCVAIRAREKRRQQSVDNS